MTEKRPPNDDPPSPSTTVPPRPEVAALTFEDGDTDSQLRIDSLDDVFDEDPFFSEAGTDVEIDAFNDDPSVISSAPELPPRKGFQLPPINLADIIVGGGDVKQERIEEPTMLVPRELLFGDEDDEKPNPDIFIARSPAPPDQPRYKPPVEPEPEPELDNLPEHARTRISAPTMPLSAEDIDLLEAGEVPSWADAPIEEVPEDESGLDDTPRAPPNAVDIDAALAALQGESVVDDEVVDPYAVSGLYVIEEPTNAGQKPRMVPREPTRQIEYRMRGLEGEADLPEPWTDFVGEMRGEIVAQRDARTRAAYLHEVADVLRMSGDRWRVEASGLDALALDLSPTYVPSLRSRLVDGLVAQPLEPYERILEMVMGMLAGAKTDTPESRALVAALQSENAVMAELSGDTARALAAYDDAATAGRDPFFALNRIRLALSASPTDVGTAAAAYMALADHAGEGTEGGRMRAIWMADAAEMLRRHGDTAKATRLLRQALEADPVYLPAYRSMQLLAWSQDDKDLEIEGLTGQLAILVESGRKMRRNNARLRLMKRRAAARFFRLGQLLRSTGRGDEAVKALEDALGIRRHELLYLRALERVSRESGNWKQVAGSITRQLGLIVDPVLQSLLLVEQAHVTLQSGNIDLAKEQLERSLEIAPDCLPARIDLGRLMLSEGRWEALLELRRSPSEEAPDPQLDHARRRASDAWRRGEIREFMLDDAQAAADEYILACQWDPTEGPWLRAAERLTLRTGRWTELGQLYERIIAHSTSALRRHGAILKSARVAELRGENEAAIKHLLVLIDEEDAPLRRLEELAHLYRKTDWMSEAVQVFEQIVEMAEALLDEPPTEDDAEERSEAAALAARCMGWLAHFYEHEVEDTERALALHQKVLVLRPADSAALERLREVLVRRGEWGRLADLLQEQAVGTNEGEVRRDLLLEAATICMDRLRDRNRGLAILRELCVLFPRDAAVLDATEDALRKQREWNALAELLMHRARGAGKDDPHQGARLAIEAALLRRDRLLEPESALESFKLGLEIAPGLGAAQRGAARLMAQLGLYSELAAHYTEWRKWTRDDEMWIALAAEHAHLLEFELDAPEEALALHAEILGRSSARLDSLVASVRLNARVDKIDDLIGSLRRLSDRVVDRQDKIAFLLRAGRLSERSKQSARGDYERVLELDPSCAPAQRGLERSLKAAGEHAPLLTLYLERAKAVAGAHRVHYLVRIANVYEQMGRLEDATEILRKVLVLDPHYELARMSLARLARHREDWETAAEMEMELVEGAPSQELRLAHLSAAASIYQHRIRDKNRAEPLLKKIIEIDPSSPEAYDSLRSFYGEGRTEGELDSLLDVIDARLQVEDGAAQVTLLREGARLAGARRPDRARRYLETLLAVNPNDSPALLQLAELAESTGDVDGAVSMLSRWMAVEERTGGLGTRTADEQTLRNGILLRIATLLVDRVRDVRAAEPYLNELIASDATNPEACGLMARAQILLGEPEKACDLYKDLFELQPTATLALQIAWLLDGKTGRKQEALAWYMRAQDLDPLSADAMKGFYGVMQHIGARAPSTVHVRVLQDRLDWLAESYREAIDEEPWQLDHFRQLARILDLRGDKTALRDVAGVLAYFDLAEDANVADAARDIAPSDPTALLAGEVELTEEDIRERVLMAGCKGIRRRVFSLVWESVATVDPNDLRRRGLNRSDRLDPRSPDRRMVQIGHLARALRVYGVDIYPHPNDPYAVLALFTPEPALVIGSGIFDRADDPFHHFRVTRALEALRDGKGLMARRDAMAILSSTDSVMESLYGALPSLPIFGSKHTDDWLTDGTRRLHREVKRRVRRELRTALEPGPSDKEQADVEDWITACRVSPLRIGLAVCGEFGAAADAVAGTSFSLDKGGGPRRQEAMMTRLREGPSASDIGELLRFVVTPEYAALRKRLKLSITSEASA